jgi:hypothetical protein
VDKVLPEMVDDINIAVYIIITRDVQVGRKISCFPDFLGTVCTGTLIIPGRSGSCTEAKGDENRPSRSSSWHCTCAN